MTSNFDLAQAGVIVKLTIRQWSGRSRPTRHAGGSLLART